MDFEATRINHHDLYNARRQARLTRDQAADLAGIHRTTYTRQETGDSRPSLAVYRLLLSRAGWLPDPAWFGWRFAQGQLWTPENVGYDPGEIQAIPYQHALVADLRRQLRDLQPDRQAVPIPNLYPLRHRG